MNHDNISCNFLYSTVKDFSVPAYPLHIRVIRGMEEYRDLPYRIYSPIRNIISPQHDGVRADSGPFSQEESLNLQPGDWVQVRSIEEIKDTLDKNKKYKGLLFMPEMEKFCGMNFKTLKKIESIKLESTGEMRRLRSPTVFLDGAYCNGERHEGCDRACFHFWREAWLKRLSDP